MADAKVIVSAENRLKQGLDDAKKDLLGFGDAAEAIGDKLKNALTVTAIVVGLEKLGKAAFDCFVEFGEGERRIKQLKIALDNNETSFSRATRLIDEMRGMSLASKDQIEGLVAELATLGKSDAEIDRITRAAVNLSNVTGQDLNSAFTLINGTFTGTAGKLEKLIPELGDLTKEQLAAGGAADLINGKFGEMSKQLAEDNIPQKIKNIKDNWGEFKESIGEITAPLFNGVLIGLNAVITGINSVMEAKRLEAKLDTDITTLEKRNALERLIAIKKEQLEKQKSYRDIILGTDTTGMLSAGAGNTAVEAKVKATEAEIAGLEKELKELKAKSPELGKAEGRTVPLLTANGGAGTAPVLDAIGSLLKGTIAGPEDYYFLQQALGNQQLSAPSLPYFEPVNYTGPATLLQELSDIYSQSDDMIVGAITGLPASITDGVSTVVEPYSNTLSELMAGMTDAESYRPVVDAIDGLNGNILAYQESLLLNYAPPKTHADELSEIYAQSDDMIVGAVLGLPAGIMDGVSTVVESYSDNLSDAFAGAIDAELTQPITQGLQELNTNILTFEESFLVNYAPTKTQAQELSDIYGASGVDMVGGGTGLAVSSAAGGVETPMLAPISGFDKLVSAITLFADSLLGMITPLASIQSILNPMQTILQASFGVLEPIINSVIAPLQGILTIIGQTLGSVLAPVLKALSPIIELVGKAFVWLYNNVILPIANGLIWVFTAVQNAIAGVINAFTWLTGIYAQYASYEDAKLQKIEYGDVVQAGASAAGATAAQSAQYRSQSITINIYQQSPVVGDGGMRQFAAMIRAEFEALAYYGT